MSFGERNWHGIVRGQGYVRVLAGRARSDMLRDSPRLTQPLTPPLTPRLTPRLTPPKNFCTTHFLFQNQSFVDFTEKSEHLDVRWGRSWWKWQFSLSKTCCALTVSILSTQRISRGRDLILPTQRISRGRDLILSTQRILGLRGRF